MRREQSLRARRALDARFASLGSTDNWTPPNAGWVRAIREALGMSAAALASRMRISEPAVFSLERTEQHGTIRLDTLRRAAEAMNCTLAYVLIPNQPLEQAVHEQAGRIVDAHLQRVDQTMILEDQGVTVSSEAREALIEQVIGRRGLWSDH